MPIKLGSTAIAALVLGSTAIQAAYVGSTQVFAAGGADPAIAYLQSATIDSGTTYTFSAQNLGVAAADRRIIVAGTVRVTSVRTVDSVTIGGVAASVVVTQIDSTPRSRVFIAIADVPTGTSGDIVVTLSGAGTEMRLHAWRATGLSSNTPTATQSATNVNDPSANINVAADGICVAAAMNTNATTCSISGVTQDNDGMVNGQHCSVAGSLNPASAQTPLAVAATFGGADTRGTLCAAAWS